MELYTAGQISNKALVKFEFQLGIHIVPPIKYVDGPELRKLFNEGRYADLVSYGALFERLIREDTPIPSVNEPPGTRSQILAYLDNKGQQICIVHRYLRSDGTLGASGRPDPKKLLHEGTLYILDAPAKS